MERAPTLSTDTIFHKGENMKVKNKKEIKKDEFRKNNSDKVKSHPVYIYAKIGNEFKYIGITHAEITQGIKNIVLDKNPNPHDNKKAYARPKAEKEKTSKFGKTLEGWKLSKQDKEKISKIKK